MDIDHALASWDDYVAGHWRRITGAAFVCELPRELGIVTGLTVEHGRVVAATESGIPFIVPLDSPGAA